MKVGFNDQAEVVSFGLSKEEIDYKADRTETVPAYDPDIKTEGVNVKLNDLPKEPKTGNKGTKKNKSVRVV